MAIAAISAVVAACLTAVFMALDPSLGAVAAIRSWAFWSLVCAPVVVLGEIVVRTTLAERLATVDAD